MPARASSSAKIDMAKVAEARQAVPSLIHDRELRRPDGANLHAAQGGGVAQRRARGDALVHSPVARSLSIRACVPDDRQATAWRTSCSSSSLSRSRKAGLLGLPKRSLLTDDQSGRTARRRVRARLSVPASAGDARRWSRPYRAKSLTGQGPGRSRSSTSAEKFVVSCDGAGTTAIRRDRPRRHDGYARRTAGNARPGPAATCRARARRAIPAAPSARSTVKSPCRAQYAGRRG